MTSGGFLSLYYTDCRPGQGLRGGAGFQFQSVSSGVSHEMMTLVQRSALYEAPVAWMREHRAVASYPPSLTHVFDGRYVTARGIYLGAEANGVREGNQFTHAVTTDDPASYGLTRPAQLWEAPWWSEQPAASTECDPVAAQPEQGPWSIDAIREWVLGQPDAEDWLIAVSSAFDQVQETNHRRVLFVGDDAADILGWIAAGTLLLPQPRAVRLSFRVFAINPQYSQHDVLGLHPDWAGSFANPGRDGEFVVFNLGSGKHSAVEHTDAAAYWALKFLRADPLEVLDAIELAHGFAWQRHQRTDGSAAAADARADSADRLASAIVVLGESVDGERQASALARWLAEQPSLALDDIVEPVARAVLASSTDATALGDLDRAVWLHGLRGELASQVRCAFLSAEVRAVISGGQPRSVAVPIPRHPWTDAERHCAIELIEQAADTILPNRMDLLLRVSASFEIEPRVPIISDAAHRFVTWWVDHPAVRLDPAGWPCRDMFIDLLRDELARRPDSAALRSAVREQWWPILLPIIDPGSPLYASVSAAAMERGQPALQRDVFTAVLEFAQRSDRPDTGDLAWDALFRYVVPTTDQLLQLLRRLRRETASATFVSRVHAALDLLCRFRVSATELDALAALTRLGAEPRDKRLVELWRQDMALQQWLASVSTHAQPRAATSGLDSITEPVLRARRADVLDAVLDAVPLACALDVLDAAGDQLQSFLLTELPALWNDDSGDGRRGDAAVMVTYLISGLSSLPDRFIDGILARLEKWIRSASIERLDRVERLLQTADPEGSEDWRQAVADLRPKIRRTELAGIPTVAKKPPNDTAQQAKTPGRWLGFRRGGK